MTDRQTFDTLILWLNGCITYEQVILLDRVAKNFLAERFDAMAMYDTFLLASGIKKDLLKRPVTYVIENELEICNCTSNFCNKYHVRDLPQH